MEVKQILLFLRMDCQSPIEYSDITFETDIADNIENQAPLIQ